MYEDDFHTAIDELLEKINTWYVIEEERDVSESEWSMGYQEGTLDTLSTIREHLDHFKYKALGYY